MATQNESSAVSMGAVFSHEQPRSREVLWSCGETMIGVVQLKRYFAVIGGAVRSHALAMKLSMPDA